MSKEIKFRHISELERLMTLEQKERSKQMYEKFYDKPFGKLDAVNCGPNELEDGEEYLKEVDLNDFE